MKWISKYDLFLFDLDGLLVNTEELHFEAYAAMCQNRGIHLDWNFGKYFSIAQLDAEAVRRQIYAEFPELLAQESDWRVLYAEKKKSYIEILHSHSAPLLPGAEELLKHLAENDKKRCVVTHSQKELVDLLRRKNPVLDSIPYWFTREDYEHPKPSPDGYLKAIDQLAGPHDAIIGFEDSRRGLNALIQTGVTAVLVNDLDAAMRSEFQNKGIATFSSLTEVLQNQIL